MSTLFVDSIQPKTTGSTISYGGQMFQQWQLPNTLQLTGNTTTTLTTWVKSSDQTFGVTGASAGIVPEVGASMSTSSGIFTFPVTGIYKLEYHVMGSCDGGARLYIGGRIEATVDNSNYSTIGSSLQGGYANGHRTDSNLQMFFNVTNTSTHKIKTVVRHADTVYVEGTTAEINTSIIFTRLGAAS